MSRIQSLLFGNNGDDGSFDGVDPSYGDMGFYPRLLGGGGGDSHGEGEDSHGEFGVHIEYKDLYGAFVFLSSIYLAGAVASKVFKMPSLVGEIFAGILLGPPLADFVPNAEAWVLIGEIGLILLVLEAGVDIDLTTLKLIGARGFIIAVVGSILPIVIGMGIAFALGTDTKGAIAAGATFGPTSLGIAMNILREGKIVNTPVGQLIVSAAVIDDMIALVILSQLSALTGDISIAAVVLPIVSAFGFLIIGGYCAIMILPDIIDNFILAKIPEQHRCYASIGIMFALVIALMPATFYAKASYLMGVFIAGLTFARNHEVHHMFVVQFKRLLQWLMRIFFAASIGFQVPIKDFGSGKVILEGLIFTVALTGKLLVGFLVPNFNQTKRFTGLHLRDCLSTGFSMAAEGEFAFVIAVFSVDEGLIDKDLYASLVLAVLLSTIIPPFLLRYTINKYNRKSEEAVRQAAALELERDMNLESGRGDIGGQTIEEREQSLRDGIKNRTTVFLCIQSQSASSWGLLPRIMETMRKLGLEVIDHRSWHPRGVNTTLVNEIYVKDNINISQSGAAVSLDERTEEIKEKLLKTIHQEEAKVKVQRWFPGVLEEVVEEVETGSPRKESRKLTLSQRLVKEASHALEKKRDAQVNLTKEKSLEQILQDVTVPEKETQTGEPRLTAPVGASQQRKPRKRQKMRSTPVVGGGLFGETSTADFREQFQKQAATPEHRSMFRLPKASKVDNSVAVEVYADGHCYNVRMLPATLNRIKEGILKDSEIPDHAIHVSEEDAPVEQKLRGFVRNDATLTRITEEVDMSEASEHNSKKGDGDEGNPSSFA